MANDALVSSAEDAPPFDVPALSQWMDERGLGSGPLRDVSTLTGGTQNTVVAFRRGTREFVLRLPPLRSGDRGNGTMRREATVLGALRDTDVPHPRLIAAEHDDTPLGAAFYLMERVVGHCVIAGPPPGVDAWAYGDGIGPAVASALARLSTVEPAAVGLDGFGRPDGYLERQVTRWRWQLEQYLAMDGYPGWDLPHVEEITSWLEGNRPADQTATVLHGDVHLGNVLFHFDRPAVAAFIDWELATVGDPLVDLAQLLVTWPDGEGRSAVGPAASAPGLAPLASEDELVAAYAAVSPRDLGALTWYKALACFRMGSIVEGTRARACGGLAPVSVGEELHLAARALFERAVREIEQA